MRYDTLIIGASLSGLMAARRLSEGSNAHFLVLEAKAQVGSPLKCGEAVEQSTLLELFGTSVYRQPFILRKIERHRVQLNQIQRTFQFPYFELDRPAFERWLAEPVEKKLRLGCRVSHVTRDGSDFVVQTNDNHFRSRSVVLACGTYYALLQDLGLIRNEPRTGYAFGQVRAPPAHFSTDEFLWRVEPDLLGYSWCFPKGEHLANVGSAGIKVKSLRKRFAQFIEIPNDSRQADQITNGGTTLGGRYPIDGPLRKTYGTGLLVVGDAAGMVYAGTGEGITFALRSGDMAGTLLSEALRENDLSEKKLRTYETRWQSEFGKRLKNGKLFLRLLELMIHRNILEKVISKIPESWIKCLITGEALPWRACLLLLLHFFRWHSFRWRPFRKPVAGKS